MTFIYGQTSNKGLSKHRTPSRLTFSRVSVLSLCANGSNPQLHRLPRWTPERDGPVLDQWQSKPNLRMGLSSLLGPSVWGSAMHQQASGFICEPGVDVQVGTPLTQFFIWFVLTLGPWSALSSLLYLTTVRLCAHVSFQHVFTTTYGEVKGYKRGLLMLTTLLIGHTLTVVEERAGGLSATLHWVWKLKPKPSLCR